MSCLTSWLSNHIYPTAKKQEITYKDASRYLFKEQINIKEQIPRYLVAELKLLTTKCVLIETEKIAKKALGALAILKQFGIHQCGHRTPVSGADCLLSMVGQLNENHYLIATQDRALQDILRTIPGTPLIYLHLKAPTLEKPSDCSYELAKEKTESTFSTTATQDSTLKSLKEMSGLKEDESKTSRKRKKKGGPNPLSCLKKKKKQRHTENKNSVPEGKIKKRKRMKLPAHVKTAIKSS